MLWMGTKAFYPTGQLTLYNGNSAMQYGDWGQEETL